MSVPGHANADSATCMVSSRHVCMNSDAGIHWYEYSILYFHSKNIFIISKVIGLPWQH